MYGDVAKIYFTPHKTHIRNEAEAESSHCKRRLSGVAWWIAEYYVYHTQRPICETCLKIYVMLKPERQQQGNKWKMA